MCVCTVENLKSTALSRSLGHAGDASVMAGGIRPDVGDQRRLTEEYISTKSCGHKISIGPCKQRAVVVSQNLIY